MGRFFEIAVGIILCIFGLKILQAPDLIVAGHQLEILAYNTPLGIFICAAGLLWIWMGARRRS